MFNNIKCKYCNLDLIFKIGYLSYNNKQRKCNIDYVRSILQMATETCINFISHPYKERQKGVPILSALPFFTQRMTREKLIMEILKKNNTSLFYFKVIL